MTAKEDENKHTRKGTSSLLPQKDDPKPTALQRPRPQLPNFWPILPEVGIFTFGRTILLHPLRLKQKVLSLSFRHVSEANKEEPAFAGKSRGSQASAPTVRSSHNTYHWGTH